MTTIAILQVPNHQVAEITIPNGVDRTIVVHQNQSRLSDSQSDTVLHVLNERGDLPCGRWNHAIDVLISHRFQWNINLNEAQILLEGWESPIGLIQVLQAGGYDEALSSFYHEDLLIRLGEISSDTLPENFDISTILSSTNGDPTLFAMKHQFRLNQQEWKLLLEKIPTSELQLQPDEGSMQEETKEIVNFSRKMVIGVTFGNIELAERFLLSFRSLNLGSIHPIKLIICLHNLHANDIQMIIEKSGLELAEIIIHDEEWGHIHGINGTLGPWFIDEDSRNGVSWGRCVLHYAIWLETNSEQNPLIWILDDDIVVESHHLNNINQIADEMKLNGFTIGIGQVLGDPPIMSIYSIRTQLIDYYYANLAILNPSRKRIRIDYNLFNEVHHDLSTIQMDHLEFPIGFHAASQNNIDVQAIMSGKSITRPVHSEWNTKKELPARGGNTLLLDSTPLSRWSNVAPCCGGIQFRRGDTLWTQWVELEAPETICSIPLVVHQIRQISNPAPSSTKSIRGDIAGSMLVRAIKGVETSSEIQSSTLASRVLSGSKLRESRLITNLLRVLHLMQFIGVEKHFILEIEKLTSDLIIQDWPESLTCDLRLFLDEINTSMQTFNLNHQSQSNY